MPTYYRTEIVHVAAVFLLYYWSAEHRHTPTARCLQDLVDDRCHHISESLFTTIEQGSSPKYLTQNDCLPNVRTTGHQVGGVQIIQTL